MANSISILGYAKRNGIGVQGHSKQVIIVPEVPIEEPTRRGGRGIRYITKKKLKQSFHLTIMTEIKKKQEQKLNYLIGIKAKKQVLRCFPIKFSISKCIKNRVNLGINVGKNRVIKWSIDNFVKKYNKTSIALNSVGIKKQTHSISIKINKCVLMSPEDVALLAST